MGSPTTYRTSSRSASRSTTTCVIGTSKRARASSTIPRSSQCDRPSGCVEMISSSASNRRSQSSTACKGSLSPISPRASTPSCWSRSRLSASRSGRLRPRRVLVRRPVPHRRVQHGHYHEDVRVRAGGALLDHVQQRLPADSLVRDDEDPPLVLRMRVRRRRARRALATAGAHDPEQHPGREDEKDDERGHVPDHRLRDHDRREVGNREHDEPVRLRLAPEWVLHGARGGTRSRRR